MADHNTLIGSTAREIESGTVLIGGVVREIESGTVLVGGVAREIAFSQPVSITISGTVKNGTFAYCTVDGVKVGPDTASGSLTIEVDNKQVVAVYVSSSGTYLGSRCKVTLNRTTVLSGAGTYTLDITQYTTVTIKFTSQRGLVTGGSELIWSAAITAS